MPNELSENEWDIDDDVELPLLLTTLAQALDYLQVVRKYFREQPEILNEIFSTLHII